MPQAPLQELKLTPSFPNAPQQSTRLFSSIPMHNLMDHPNSVMGLGGSSGQGGLSGLSTAPLASMQSIKTLDVGGMMKRLIL
jgi:hypothetical protein